MNHCGFVRRLKTGLAKDGEWHREQKIVLLQTAFIASTEESRPEHNTTTTTTTETINSYMNPVFILLLLMSLGQNLVLLITHEPPASPSLRGVFNSSAPVSRQRAKVCLLDSHVCL